LVACIGVLPNKVVDTKKMGNYTIFR